MALSDESGLDQTYISGIETGQRNPTIIVLDELAKVLDVPIVGFFEGYLPKRPAAKKS